MYHLIVAGKVELYHYAKSNLLEEAIRKKYLTSK